MSVESPMGKAWQAHVQGQNDAAVDQFQALANATPDDVDALYGLGLAQRSAGQVDDAVATFNRILELLGEVNAESEDEHNRLEMLTRMVNQQIALAQKAK